MPFTSKFLLWCAVWIAGSAVFQLIFQTGKAEDRFLFATSTLAVAGLLWILEHIEWKSR